MDNRLEDFIDDYLYFKQQDDTEGLKALKVQSREKYVTMEEVGETIFKIIHDFMNYTDASQAVMEARMKAVVDELPDGTKNKILEEFDKAEDGLFKEEGEEVKHD